MNEEKYFYEKLISPQARVFLDEKGLTMSEASHQADMVKEELAKVAADFENTAGFRSTVDLKGKVVKLDNFIAIPDLYEAAQIEGEYYGLSAWLREGVKSKEEALNTVKRTRQDQFVTDTDEVFELDIPYPEELFAKIVEPTEQDVLGTFTIKERAEYLMLEAKAAHIGKKIHDGAIKKGKILQIRDQVLSFQEHDLKEYPSGGGKDVFLITNTPLYLKDYIDDVFMKLQEKHRSLEAKLNWYRGRIKDELSAMSIAANEAYRKESRTLANKHREEMAVYTAKLTEHSRAIADRDTMREGRRLATIKYVAKLKIIIPEELTALAAKIASLSKTDEG